MSGSRMGMPQIMNGNNRRPMNFNRTPTNEKSVHQQHDDLIKYICDSWNKVSQERNTGASVHLYKDPENHNLKDFEPFDLESFCERRLVQNMPQSHNS